MAALAARRGAFILFEGVDRSGKTTQCKRLVEHLKSRDVPVEFMRFPDRTTAIGKMINEYLTGGCELDDHAIHLLFAANRWEVRSKIISTLNSGTTLVVDRYSFSGVAFSGAKAGMDLDWCWQSELGLPAPDVVIFLDLPIEVSKQRGGYGEERYEEEEMQRRVRENFHRMAGDCWRTVDASDSLDEVEKQVQRVADDALARAADQPMRTLGDAEQKEKDVGEGAV